MTIADAPAARPTSEARPWPGLDAFSEALSRFFFGRDSEAEELSIRVRRDPVTLLFGQSGLGKTSLLQAGLFPRLRAAGFLPILIRLDYAVGAAEPAAQVKATIEREFAAAGVTESTPIGVEDSLWGYFHRAERTLVGADGKNLIPVLVFDQFEEMFTLGLAREASRSASQAFLGELAELIENRPPEAIGRAIEADPDLIDTYLFDRRDYRIVLTLREDFLAQLEALRARAPSIGRNRFRLRRMSGRQGLDAVTKPAPELVDRDIAEEIIRFIGRANPEDAFGSGDAATEFEIEPSLLSLVCRELNERRIARGLDRITRDLLVGSREDIIASFYDGVLADQPAALREFVEDELLSDSGYRESISLERAHRVLATKNVPIAALDELVRRRLLRIEERLDVSRVEIIHDVLTGVIRHSRDSRRLRQTEAEAKSREATLLHERHRAQRIFAATAAGLVFALALAGVAGWQWRMAEAQRTEAEAQRTVAEAQRKEAETQRALAESQKKEAETQRALAVSQQKEAEEQRALAESQKKEAEAQRTRAQHSIDLATGTANSLIFNVVQKYRNSGVPAPVIKEILDQARKLQDELSAGGETSPRLRRSQAAALMETSNTLLALGDTAGAFEATTKSRDILLDLLKPAPDSTDFQRELSVAHEKVGDVLKAQGDFNGALASYRSSLAIRVALTQKNPEDTQWQRDLSVSHEEIGDIVQIQGDLEAALVSYRDSLAIRKKLTEKNSANAQWQRDLSVSDEKIGEVLKAQGDLPGALSIHREALAIRKTLAQKDPRNTQLQRDISVSQNKIGDVLKAQDNLDGALAAYREGLDIIKNLARQDPGNTLWQRDLSISDERIADVLQAKGDTAGALALYREDLVIARSLAQKDPGNAQWQTDLVLSLWRVAIAGDTPVENYNEALKILRRLDAAGYLSPSQKRWIATIESNLTKVKPK